MRVDYAKDSALMREIVPWLVATALLLPGCAEQEESSSSPVAGQTSSEQPYAGFEERPIKTLSQQKVEDLLAGRGAGYALAAELNSYPGPRHVLDLADELDRCTE